MPLSMVLVLPLTPPLFLSLFLSLSIYTVTHTYTHTIFQFPLIFQMCVPASSGTRILLVLCVSFSHTSSCRARITFLVKIVSKRLDVLFAFRDHFIPTQLLCLFKGFICHYSSAHLAHLTPSHQFCLLFDSSSITLSLLF